MELAVYNIQGEDTGKKVELSDVVFNIEPNEEAVYQAVRLHMANKRQGTHKSKERAEISGSTRKIKKQKGTGTARAGSIKSGVFRGGGRIFGPRPRNYGFKLNKKVKVLARKSALTYKAKANNITVLEDFKFEQPKTKEFLSIVSNLDINSRKPLFVVAETDKNIYLSSRNVPNAKVINVTELNTYDVMNASTLVITESSISKVHEMHQA